MFLVISEKPSVSYALAGILGAGKRERGYLSGRDCIVSWCLGHLAGYAPPEDYDPRYKKWAFADLPIIPEDWQLSVAEDKKRQYAVLKELLGRKDFDYVVNACDAGREGELIFRRVYDLSGSKLPVRRLWISSMEDSAIREGFANLREGSAYADLCASSICRAKADWLIGMNATRAFTTRYHKRLVVGRVQTPTLAMLVERQDAIDGFEGRSYHKVTIEGDQIRAVSESIADEADSLALAGRCDSKSAVVSKVEKTRRETRPPRLYDLTTLQREADRFFGYTAQETSQGLQELYEAKLVTYPRTDSMYITADMEQTVRGLLGALPGMFLFLGVGAVGTNIGNIIDDGKVTDHHALLPTKEAVHQDIGGLPEGQRHILWLIGQRLAQAVSGSCIYEETVCTVICEGHEFSAKGKTIIRPGFKGIEDAFRGFLKKGGVEDPDGSDDVYPTLDGIHEGMAIAAVTAKGSRHRTAPPRPYTEDTLLAAMERAGSTEFDKDTEKKGLGTSATRAAILEKLVSSGYAQRKGRQILPTADGRALIAVLPEYLKSASMTAEWENRLLMVERGEMDSGTFMQGITDMVGQIMEGCRAMTGEEQCRFNTEESIGTCPVCGSPVYEGKKSFYCGDWECPFALWKENRYLANMKKLIDKGMAVELLGKGRTRVRDLYSQKTGRTFTADLVMDVSDGRANFSLIFPKKKGERE